MKYEDGFVKLLGELMVSPEKGRVSRYSNTHNNLGRLELGGVTYDVLVGPSAEVCNHNLRHVGKGYEIVFSAATECASGKHGCRYESVEFVAIRPDGAGEGRFEKLLKGKKYCMVPKKELELAGTSTYRFHRIDCEEDEMSSKYPAVWFGKELSHFALE